MKKTGWVLIATLFIVLAVLWLTVGAWFVAKQLGVAQLPALPAWGVFLTLIALFAGSVYAGCKAPE